MVAGVESEAGLGFATIHRLLTPYLDGVNRLPAPQRSALEVALGLRDGPPGTPFLCRPRGAVATGRRGARNRLLIVVVDDAQWLDPESLQALGFGAADTRRAARADLRRHGAAATGRPRRRSAAPPTGLEIDPATDLLVAQSPPASWIGRSRPSLRRTRTETRWC